MRPFIERRAYSTRLNLWRLSLVWEWQLCMAYIPHGSRELFVVGPLILVWHRR